MEVIGVELSDGGVASTSIRSVGVTGSSCVLDVLLVAFAGLFLLGLCFVGSGLGVVIGGCGAVRLSDGIGGTVKTGSTDGCSMVGC